MALEFLRKNGSISNIIRRKLRNSTTGQGLTGLSSSSSGLIISTICDNEAAATVYTQAGSTIESITTLATFAAPTATKCRFKELDATNHPGVYEFQFADARFAVSGAKMLRVSISGATNLLEQEIKVQLTAHDLTDSAQVQADVAKWLTVAPLALSSQQVQAIVPDTQKVDVNTFKTQAITCSGAVTIPAATLASTTNITAGTITTVTTVTNQLTAAQIATGVWQDSTAGDFTTASSIGKSLYTSGAVPGAAGGLFIAGSNATTTMASFVITAGMTIGGTGNAAQTGDSYPIVSSGTYGNAAIKTDQNAIGVTVQAMSPLVTSTNSTVASIDSRTPAALTSDGLTKSDALRINGVSTGSVTTISDHIGTTGASTAQTGDNFPHTSGLPHTYYVATTGNDSNAGTEASPKLTINGAIAVHSPGDTIRVAAGTYSGSITNAKHRVTIVGDSRSNTILTYNSGATFTNTGNHLTLRSLSLRATGTVTTPQIAFTESNTVGTWLDQLDIRGGDDCVNQLNCYGARITGCKFSGKWDCIVGTGAVTVEGCYITSDGSFDPAATLNVISAAYITCRNTVIDIVRTNDATGDTWAASPIVGVFEDCLISAQLTGDAPTGKVGGIAVQSANSIIFTKGCKFVAAHSVDPTKAYHYYSTDSTSSLAVQGTLIDESKISAGAVVRFVDGGPDWSLVRNKTTANILSGTTIGTASAIGSGGITDASFAAASINKAKSTGWNDIAAGAAMTLTSGERTALQGAFLDETDGEAVLAAILAKINTISATDVSSLAIAAAVRTNLTTELARLDAAISSRLSTSGYTVPPSAAANAAAVRTNLTTELARIDIPVSEAGGDSAWNTTKVAQALAALSIGADIGVPVGLTWVIARIDGNIKARVPIVKGSTEAVTVAADFRNILGDDEAIDSITSIALINDGHTGTIAAAAFSDVTQATLFMNAIVEFVITGGTIGQSDRVLITVHTLGGNTYAAPCTVKVVGA